MFARRTFALFCGVNDKWETRCGQGAEEGGGKGGGKGVDRVRRGSVEWWWERVEGANTHTNTNTQRHRHGETRNVAKEKG